MWKFTIATYNLMVPVPEPLRNNGQTIRVQKLPQAIEDLTGRVLNGLDVIAVQELIPNHLRAQFLEHMKQKGFLYHTASLKTDYMSLKFKAVNGGVIILSKHPILVEYNKVFDTECESVDCIACKGVVYCRIQLENKNIVNVLSTHFQAWDTCKGRRIRRQQAICVKKFIDSLHIPKDEPVILVGDLNLDFYNHNTELHYLLGIMKLKLNKFNPNSTPFSSDPRSNTLVGNDDTIRYATDKYPKGCYEDYLNSLSCPCCPRELLDYVTFSINHLQPIDSEMSVFVIKTKRRFNMKFNITTERETNDLSDHYPVIGSFSWNKPTRFTHRSITLKPDNTKTIEHRCLIYLLLFSILVGFLWIVST